MCISRTLRLLDMMQSDEDKKTYNNEKIKQLLIVYRQMLENSSK